MTHTMTVGRLLRSWSNVVSDRIRLLRLLSYSGRPTVSALLSCGLVALASPALFAIANGWLIRSIGGGLPVGPLVSLAVLLVATQLAEVGQGTLTIKAARLIDGRVRSLVRTAAALPPTISHLEQEDFHHDVTRASDLGGNRGRVRSPGTAALGQVTLTLRVLTAVSAAAIVAVYAPLLAATLLVLSLACRAIIRRQWMFLADVDSGRANEERRMEYWTELLGGSPAAKEVRLFGLRHWLAERRLLATESWLDIYSAERGKIMRHQTPIILLSILSAMLALGVPAYYAATGAWTPATAVICLFAGWFVLGISAMGHEAFDIEYGSGAVKAFDRVLARARELAASDPKGKPVPETTGPPGVRLRDVTFAYLGADPTLRGLDLDIRPGERLAIVGRNGAGKTTLIKLLCGLYRPTSGAITIEGHDLRELEMVSWRRQLTVVIQNFNRYPLTLRDNVTLAAPEVPVDDDSVRQALTTAGADHLLAMLPEGLETMLWKGERELSSGQWQLVAIARAVYAVAHGRRIVVLDEPTSHLDVDVEAAFFDRMVAATPGATVILISHRLSTIRSADRIVLLDDGRIVEEGSHETLMAHDESAYGRLFRLQAKRFRENDEALA